MTVTYRHLTKFACALALSGAMLASVAGNASALSIGLQWSGNIAESDSPSEWNVIQHSGASIYRLAISWREWNEKGSSPYDEAFGYAAERGIKILPYLVDRKSGKAGFPRSSEEPEYGEWYSWVKQVVRRYGYSGNYWVGKPYYMPVQTWEVWNEPNLAEESPENIVQPENYARFLVYTSEAIHAAQSEQQPSATPQVLFGSLTLVPLGSPNMGYETFLNKAYEVAGLYKSYDGLGIHPYALWEASKITEMNSEITGIRNALKGHTWGPSRSLWITELGWPVANPNLANEEQREKESKQAKGSAVKPVTEAQQASLLQESFNSIKSQAASKNIQSLIWYNVRDFPLHETWAYSCGLQDVTGNYRPAWDAFQAETGAAPWPQQEILDGANHVWGTAGSLTGSWLEEDSSSEAAISAGDNLQMILDPAGQIWARNGIGTGWEKETPSGHVAIAAGGSGLQMLLDGGGKVWARTGVGGSWAEETPYGETAIAAGGGGLQMLLDGGGQIWAKNTVGGGGWAQETWAAMKAVSAGDNGLQMLIDPGGQVYTQKSIGAGWVLESPTGVTAAAVSAGDGVEMMLDGSGNVWAKTDHELGTSGWVKEASGMKAIAAGGGGLQMVIDYAGKVSARIGVGTSWKEETPSGEHAIAAGG
jgi:hypothetical protein